MTLVVVTEAGAAVNGVSAGGWSCDGSSCDGAWSCGAVVAVVVESRAVVCGVDAGGWSCGGGVVAEVVAQSKKSVAACGLLQGGLSPSQSQ